MHTTVCTSISSTLVLLRYHAVTYVLNFHEVKLICVTNTTGIVNMLVCVCVHLYLWRTIVVNVVSFRRLTRLTLRSKHTSEALHFTAC
jgi:hypothetical protein